ncbi:hypothetical protein [Orenia marismortui]|nr:hypothetical protein [Orenia marismortui]
MSFFQRSKVVLFFVIIFQMFMSTKVDAETIHGREYYKSNYNNLTIASDGILVVNRDAEITTNGNFIINNGGKVIYEGDPSNIRFTVTGDTVINGTIDLAGVNGENGGRNKYGHGIDGTSGENGVSLRINSKTLTLNGIINTAGGDGGKGGSGKSRSSVGANGKDGGNGGLGGDAGSIEINVEDGDLIIGAGEIRADAGMGGYGGSGGSGGLGGHRGDDGLGGISGTAGEIKIRAKYFENAETSYITARHWTGADDSGRLPKIGEEGSIDLYIGYGEVSDEVTRESEKRYINYSAGRIYDGLVEIVDYKRGSEIIYNSNNSYGGPPYITKYYIDIFEKRNIMPDFNLYRDEIRPIDTALEIDVTNDSNANNETNIKYVNIGVPTINLDLGDCTDKAGSAKNVNVPSSGIKGVHFILKEQLTPDKSLSGRVEEYSLDIKSHLSVLVDKKEIKERDLEELETNLPIKRTELQKTRELLEELKSYNGHSGPPPTSKSESQLETEIENLENEIAQLEEDVVLLGKEIEVIESEIRFYQEQEIEFEDGSKYIRIIDDFTENNTIKIGEYSDSLKTRLAQNQLKRDNKQAEIVQLGEDKLAKKLELQGTRESLQKLKSYNGNQGPPPTKTEDELEDEIKDLEDELSDILDSIEESKDELQQIILEIKRLELRKQAFEEITIKDDLIEDGYKLADGEYNLRVKLRDNAGNEVNIGKEEVFSIDTATPNAPDNQTIESSIETNEDDEYSLNIKWSPAKDSKKDSYSSGIYQYKIIVRTNNESIIQYVKSDEIVEGKINSSYSLDSIGYNKSINYEIKSIDNAGNFSKNSTIGQLVTPPAKAAIDTDTIENGWSNNSANGQGSYYVKFDINSVGMGAASYQVLRRNDLEEGSVFNAISNKFTIPGEKYSFIDKTSLTAHGKYTYKLRTFNSLNDAEEGNETEIRIQNNKPQPKGIIEPSDDTIMQGNEGILKFKINAFEDIDDDLLQYELIIKKGSTEIKRVSPITNILSEKVRFEVSTDNLEDGKYKWYVLVDDGAGGKVEDSEKAKTAEYSFEIDRVKPSKPEIILDNNISTSDITKIVNIDSDNNLVYTNSKQLSLKNIKVVDGDIAKLKIEIAGVVFVEGVNLIKDEEENQYLVKNNIEIDLGQSLGEKEIKISTIDKAGNESNKTSLINCIYDNQIPNYGIENPFDSSYRGGDGQVVVSWNTPNSGISGVDYYKLEYKKGIDIGNSEVPFISIDEEIREAQYIIPDLNDNEKIEVRVKVFDKSGNESKWFSEEEYGYSLAEKGAILEQSFKYEKKSDGSYNHSVELKLKAISAKDFMVKWQKESGEEINSNPIHPIKPNDADWITVTNFTIDVEAHASYKVWIVSRNSLGEVTAVSEDDKVSIQVPNNKPPEPEIETAKFEYISANPTLETLGSIDPDDDELIYYFTIIDQNNNNIVDRKIGNGESYQIINDLNNGELYTWYVEVYDGYISDSLGDKTFVKSAEINSRVDSKEPRVEILTESNDSYASKKSVKVQVSDRISGIRMIEYWWEGDSTKDISSDSENHKKIYPKEASENSFSFSIQAPDGQNELKIKAVDNVGNSTANPITKTYKVDKTPPRIEDLVINGQTSEFDAKYYTTNNSSLFGTWQIVEDKNISLKYYKYAVITKDEKTKLDYLSKDRFIRIEKNYLPSYDEEESNYKFDFSQLAELSLEEGEEYYLVVEGVNGANRSTGRVLSQNGIMVDFTPPQISDISLNNIVDKESKAYINDFNKFDISVDISDATSGLSKVRYALVRDKKQINNVKWSESLKELKNSIQLIDGEGYYLAVKAVDNLGLTSIKYSKLLIVDQTEPEITKFIAGNSSLEETYQIKPGYIIPITLEISDEVELSQVSYSIGSQVGSNDISQKLYPEQNGWLRLENIYKQQFNVEGSLGEGTYYLNVKVKNKAGLESSISSNPILVDDSSPAFPQVKDDGYYTTSDSEFHFSWTFVDAEKDIKEYEYRILNGTGDIIVDWSKAAADGRIDGQSHRVAVNLNNGMSYFVEVRSFYQDSSYSKVGSSDGITVDATKAINLSINDGSYITGDSVELEYFGEDKESLIKEYQVKIGTVPKGDDITRGYVKLDISGKDTLKGLELSESQLYYTTLMVTNGAGLIKEISSDGFRVDNSSPDTPIILDKGKYTNEKLLRFNWRWSQEDLESGIKEYKYALLTTREVDDNTEWKSAGTNTEVEISKGLVENQRYYLAVKAINGAGLSTIGYSDGILIDTSIPVILEVDDRKDYQAEDSSLIADFNASDIESGIDHYEYSIGTFTDRKSIISNQSISEGNIAERGLDLTTGEVYFVTVKAVNRAGLVSMESMSDGVKIVNGYPEISNVIDYGEFTNSNEEIMVAWDSNSDVPIDYYQYAISNSENQTGLNWYKTFEKEVVITPDKMELDKFRDGQRYFVFIKGVDKIGVETAVEAVGKTDGILVDSSSPSKPVIKHQGEYTTTNFKLNWESIDAESGIEEYLYTIGTTRGGTEVTGDWKFISVEDYNKAENKILNLNLEHNKRYYLTVRAKNRAGNWSEVGYDNGVLVDRKPPTKPIVDYKGNEGYAGNYITDLHKVLDINWSSFDPETAIAGYRYQVVKVTEETKIEDIVLNWENIDWKESTETTFDIESLNLEDKNKYRIVIQTKNSLGLESETGFSRLLTVDVEDPKVEFQNFKEEIVTNSGNIDISWSVSEKSDVYYRLEGPSGNKPVEGYGIIEESPYHFNEVSVGNYVLKIYAVDLAGNTGEVVEQKIRINAKPMVLSGSDKSTYKGKTTSFVANIIDPDAKGGDVISYTWNFGDGSELLTGQVKVPEGYEDILSLEDESKKILIEVNHSFKELKLTDSNEIDKYIVTLTCTDQDRGINSDSLLIEVTNTKSGQLQLDETWFGLMEIRDDVIVPRGVTLTINPDTNIKFPRGTELTVYGNLLVKGEIEREAIFTVAGGDVINGWKGIRIDSKESDIKINGAIIENAIRGITLTKNSGELDGIIFRNNEVGLHLINASPLIKDSLFENNELYGIKEDGEANPHLYGATLFTDNGVGGYYDSELTLLTEDEILELVNDID